MKRHLSLLITLFILLVCTPLFAQNKVISLINETENKESRFWWQGGSPAFTEFDSLLVDALKNSSKIHPVIPKKAIGKVFRRSLLSDESAKNIASIFGSASLVHGELVILSLPKVANQFGVALQMHVKIISSKGSRTQDFSSLSYHSRPEQARKFAKSNLAEQLAGYIEWFMLERKQGLSGLEIREGQISISTSKGKLIEKLTQAFKENGATMTPLWAKTSSIVYKVEGISPKAIPRIADRLGNESIDIRVGKKDKGLEIRMEE